MPKTESEMYQSWIIDPQILRSEGLLLGRDAQPGIIFPAVSPVRLEWEASG